MTALFLGAVAVKMLFFRYALVSRRVFFRAVKD